MCNVFVMDNRQRHFQTFKLLILVICMYAIFVFDENLYERDTTELYMLVLWRLAPISIVYMVARLSLTNVSFKYWITTTIDPHVNT